MVYLAAERSFYAQLLEKYVAAGALRRSDSILVQFAGRFDAEVCRSLGFTNVHFTNAAPKSHSSRLDVAEVGDAHALRYAAEHFDHVICHAGLHHCSRPHQALYEMYRVARKLVLAVENQDSLLMRLADRLGVLGNYEFDAVADNDFAAGGVDGTNVPNHVYRWTRNEVGKAVRSFDPGRTVPVEFVSQWDIGAGRSSYKSLATRLHISNEEALRRLVSSAENFLNATAHRQGNIFGFVVRKDKAAFQPWMR